MKCTRHGVTFFLTLIYSVAAGADESVEAKIDRIFSKWNRPESPGAAVSVVRDGTTIFKKGYGCANLEYGIPITPSSVFHVASVSKQFTAMAILLLEKQGKLSLEDDIHKYLPELYDYGTKVTLRHLLTHTSGIRDQWQLLAIAGWQDDDLITQEQILRVLARQRALNFEPGAQEMYSNSGFTLLAEIVRRVSGKDLREFTDEYIFTPLGMNSTHFQDDSTTLVKNRAYSYVKADKAFRGALLNYSTMGATSLFSTVEDMAKWLDNFREPKIGDAKLIQEMMTPGVLNSGTKIDYGLGIGVGKFHGLTDYFHAGADAGYRSFVVWFPDYNLGVAVFGNLGSLPQAALGLHVAEVFLKDKMDFEADHTSSAHTDYKIAQISPTVYDQYAGTYVMQNGDVYHLQGRDADFGYNVLLGDSATLLPLSESEFVEKKSNDIFTFTKEEENRMELTVKQQGKTIKGGRYEANIRGAELLRYAGDYYSHELDTTYHLFVDSTGLTAIHQRNPQVRLVPFAADKFEGNQGFFQRIEFTSDSEGKVSGFLLQWDRVKNLKFTRTQ